MPHTAGHPRPPRRALKATNVPDRPACDPPRSDCAHPADEAVPWQERVDLKASTNMQARPVTPEQPLATGGRTSVRDWVHVWNAQARRSVPCALVSPLRSETPSPLPPPRSPRPVPPKVSLCHLIALAPQTAGDSRRGGPSVSRGGGSCVPADLQAGGRQRQCQRPEEAARGRLLHGRVGGAGNEEGAD